MQHGGESRALIHLFRIPESPTLATSAMTKNATHDPNVEEIIDEGGRDVKSKTTLQLPTKCANGREELEIGNFKYEI